MRMVRQLGREDWIEAGCRILCETGHAGLRVEPTARRLGVSKGSFYWHFQDRAGWRDALLAYWEHLVFAGMLPHPARAPGRAPKDAFSAAAPRLAQVRSGPSRPRAQVAPQGTGAAPVIDQVRLEAALRRWARDDAWVARSVLTVQSERQRMARPAAAA